MWNGQQDKIQSEKKSAENNSNQSEKHSFSVYIADKSYFLCFLHNYTIYQTLEAIETL